MLDYITTKISTFPVNAAMDFSRLGGVRRLHSGKGMADIRVFVAGIILIGVLLIVLHLYRKSSQWREEEKRQKAFNDQVERLGLDGTESKIVLDIAVFSKLKKIDSIFTMPAAFDQGAAVLMKNSFSAGKSLVERKHLNQQIVSIKEKLGFKKKNYSYSSNENSFRAKGLSSRQIPVGRTVLISRINSTDASPMSADIVENNHFELKLKTKDSFNGSPGEIWRVLYQLGAVIWKFDSLVVSCQGNELILSHTENIQFINRRRFVHAPVDLHGYIARFPCAKTIDDRKREFLPQFISAKITELSGPGLLITAPLKVRTGERVMVVFELEENRIIQSAAEVRRCDNGEQGYSIAVEMVNVNEVCINELISATNNAARLMAFEEDLEKPASQPTGKA